jgi:hypothetical protein
MAPNGAKQIIREKPDPLIYPVTQMRKRTNIPLIEVWVSPDAVFKVVCVLLSCGIAFPCHRAYRALGQAISAARQCQACSYYEVSFCSSSD